MFHLPKKPNKDTTPARQSKQKQDVNEKTTASVTHHQPQLSPDYILHMQSVIGNQAVQRMIAESKIQRTGDGNSGNIEDNTNTTNDANTSNNADTQQDANATDNTQTQQDVQTLQNGGPQKGSVVPITPSLIEAVNPQNEEVRKSNKTSNPKLMDKHKNDKRYEYKKVEGTAFTQDDPDPDSIIQGELGDCYFLAAMSAIARSNPQYIKDMITGPKDDGTYDVNLYLETGNFWNKSTGPTLVNVKPTFPHNQKGMVAYADVKRDDNYDKALWPMLIEKAYAQHLGSYEKTDSGIPKEAFKVLTGKDAYRFSMEDDFAGRSDKSLIELMKQFVEASYAITAGTYAIQTDKVKNNLKDKKDLDKETQKYLKVKEDDYTKKFLSSGHAYSVKAVNDKTHKITLQNPHGDSQDVSVQTFRDLFVSFTVLKV